MKLQPLPQFVKIADIKIGKRYRKSLGDLRSLSKSLADLGLLHPIIVSTEGVLVAGARRLKAAEKNGWTKIKANVLDLDDITSLRIEHDENEEHEPFTVSERVEIARAIQNRIGNRQGERTDTNATSGQLAGSETREEAAKAAGFSSTTQFRRAETVVDKGAPSLIDAMDKGEVTPSAASTLADALPKSEQAAAVKSGTVAKKSAEIKEAEKKDRWRGRCYELIAVDNPVLAAQLRADLLVTDEVLEQSVPKSCEKCWKRGPPKSGACVACERLRNPARFTMPEAGGTPDAEPHAELRRLITQLSGLITKAVNDQGSEFGRRLHDYMAVNGLLDHPQEKHGKAVFLPLKGVGLLVEKAGKEGPRYSDAEIKELYGVASGGWIPPATERRRKARVKR